MSNEPKEPEIIMILPWYDDTLTIKTNHTGIDGLTAVFSGKENGLLGFLNQFLTFTHEDHIEKILAKYEEKLHVVDVTALGAPDIEMNYKRINRNYYAVQDFPNDAALATALLSEYLSYITIYEVYFTEWDVIFNQWYLNYEKKCGKEYSN